MRNVVCALLIFMLSVFFFFKQKTAYEMRISDWSSGVCSSDLIDLSVKRLVRLHDIQIDVGNDPGNLQNLIEQVAVLRRDADPRLDFRFQIGRATSRERVCQSV